MAGAITAPLPAVLRHVLSAGLGAALALLAARLFSSRKAANKIAFVERAETQKLRQPSASSRMLRRSSTPSEPLVPSRAKSESARTLRKSSLPTSTDESAAAPVVAPPAEKLVKQETSAAGDSDSDVRACDRAMLPAHPHRRPRICIVPPLRPRSVCSVCSFGHRQDDEKAAKVPRELLSPVPRNHLASIVVFGADGNLAQKKLLPTLYLLWRRKLLPRDVLIFGFARPSSAGGKFGSTDEFRNWLLTFLDVSAGG
jgi:hypothetical protein